METVVQKLFHQQYHECLIKIIAQKYISFGRDIAGDWIRLFTTISKRKLCKFHLSQSNIRILSKISHF